MLRSKWVDPNKKVTNNGSIGVEGSVKKIGNWCLKPLVFFLLEPLFNRLPLIFAQFSHGKREVPKILTIRKKRCSHLCVEVGHRPREYVVLRKVIETAAS